MKCMHSVLVMIVTGGFVGIGSVMSLVFWCISNGSCPDSSLAGIPYPSILVVISLIPILVLILLIFQRRWLYVDYSHFVFSPRTTRVARKCKICGRHPLYQKHHARKKHNLKIASLEENFEDCGCDLCFNIKLWAQDHDWFSPLITYLRTGKA